MSNVTPISRNTVDTLLNAVAATGAGNAIKPNAIYRTFQVIGTFVGTVKVQGSNDNSTWIDLLTATSTGGWESEASWLWIRGNCTAYTSGSITVKMGT